MPTGAGRLVCHLPGNCIRACWGWPATPKMRRFWCRKRRIVDQFADRTLHMSDREKRPCGNADLPGRAT